tara:strand:- start:2236 stop:2598 length:363 start_codon:yes stop_codon:yes gene_type:complete
MVDYKRKYFKYKLKYLSLSGGMFSTGMFSKGRYVPPAHEKPIISELDNVKKQLRTCKIELEMKENELLRNKIAEHRKNSEIKREYMEMEREYIDLYKNYVRLYDEMNEDNSDEWVNCDSD